jgi:hypothetical protein
MYTGVLEAAYTGLAPYNITRSFIYVQKDGSSASIFNGDNSPKPVVTQYLQRLAFPAVQQPAGANDYPLCTGALFLRDADTQLKDARVQWSEQGLRDPAQGLSSDFAALHGERSDDGRSVYLAYKRADGAIVSVSTRAAEEGDAQFVSDSAAEWTRGGRHVTIAQVSGPDAGKGWARSLAASVDADFGQVCIEDRLIADEDAVSALGFRAPKAPKGFAALDSRLDLTRLTNGCGSARTKVAKDVDFAWSFMGAGGEIVRAGIYRYGDGFQGETVNDASLHWSDARGTRYWVAVDAKEITPALTDTLYSVARSMDASYAREPRAREGRVQ